MKHYILGFLSGGIIVAVSMILIFFLGVLLVLFGARPDTRLDTLLLYVGAPLSFAPSLFVFFRYRSSSPNFAVGVLWGAVIFGIVGIYFYLIYYGIVPDIFI